MEVGCSIAASIGSHTDRKFPCLDRRRIRSRRLAGASGRRRGILGLSSVAGTGGCERVELDRLAANGTKAGACLTGRTAESGMAVRAAPRTRAGTVAGLTLLLARTGANHGPQGKLRIAVTCAPALRHTP